MNNNMNPNYAYPFYGQDTNYTHPSFYGPDFGVGFDRKWERLGCNRPRPRLAKYVLESLPGNAPLGTLCLTFRQTIFLKMFFFHRVSWWPRIISFAFVCVTTMCMCAYVCYDNFMSTTITKMTNPIRWLKSLRKILTMPNIKDMTAYKKSTLS